jgi:DNA topoisomerase-3
MTPEQVAAAKAATPGTARRGSRRRRSGKAEQVAQRTDLGSCPLCKQGEVVETAKAYGCSRWRDGCGLTIWKTVAGHRLSKAEVRQLLELGHTGPIDGFQSKAGKPFSARLRLDAAGRLGLDFERGDGGDIADNGVSAIDKPSQPAPTPRKRRSPTLGGASGQPPTAESLHANPIQCPKCRQGQLIEGRRGYGCSRWRDGCDFVVWKEIAGHRLSEPELRALIEQGQTAPIADLADQQGNPMTGRLRLSEDYRAVPDPSSGAERWPKTQEATTKATQRHEDEKR